jgi:hypothetical protein
VEAKLMTRVTPRIVAVAGLIGSLLLGLVAVGAVDATPAAAADKRLVRFDAILAPGGKPIKDRMDLAVWRLSGSDPVSRVAERHAAPAEIMLKPGTYRVVAEYRNARRVRDITVPATGDPRQTINLKAGGVRLSLLPNINGDPIAQAIAWEVRRYRKGDTLGRKVAEIPAADRPELLLSEGWYEVFARLRGQTVRHVVQVAAGQNFSYAIVLEK